MAISCVSEPVKLNTNVVASLGTVREYLPSMSDNAPVVVPFTTTLAPTIGSPLGSLTTPEMVLCAMAKPQTQKTSVKINESFFILI